MKDDSTQVQVTNLLDGKAYRRHPTVRFKDGRGEHTILLDRKMVLGSAPGVDVAVADATVSRLHLELEPREDGLWIRDLESRNGTFVGGVLVSGARVRDADRIRVGGTELTVHYGDTAGEVDLWPSEKFGPLLGRSVAMRELFRRMAQIAGTDSTALIQGETGTGKELIARAIHGASARQDGPYVVVDCASLPESLLEAELFGHTRGAFTGAVHARVGAIEAADGGTVFLDEIGEVPLSIQPKLLRLLESKSVRRIGEVQERRVDVRLISATHRDLRRMVNTGAFREDLYFRLAVIPLHVAPLRERPEDIPLLVEAFLPPARRSALTPELVDELLRRPWLGNVRELRNFVERVLALGTEEALNMQPRGVRLDHPTEVFPAVSLEEPFKVIRDRWVSHLEREYLEGLLKAHNNNVSAVAQKAGLDRSYVHRLIRKHGL